MEEGRAGGGLLRKNDRDNCFLQQNMKEGEKGGRGRDKFTAIVLESASCQIFKKIGLKEKK